MEEMIQAFPFSVSSFGTLKGKVSNAKATEYHMCTYLLAQTQCSLGYGPSAADVRFECYDPD
jgi:hypothetical protein